MNFRSKYLHFFTFLYLLILSQSVFAKDIMGDLLSTSDWKPATKPWSEGIELFTKDTQLEFSLSTFNSIALITFKLRASNYAKYDLKCNNKSLASGMIGKQPVNIRAKVKVSNENVLCILHVTEPSSTWINLISAELEYEQAKCKITSVTYSDVNGLYTRGNGDEKIAPFEIFQLTVKAQNPESQMSLLESPYLSILKKSTEVDDDQYTWNATLTTKLSDELKTLKELPVNLKCNGVQYDYVVPFVHNLGDSLALNRKTEHIKGFNFNDPNELDEFLKRYPKSEHTQVIFNLRLKLLRDQVKAINNKQELKVAINDYHDFIKLYPQTVGSLIALNEVYQLYQRWNTLDAFTDFIYRYPESMEAKLADHEVKKLVWKAISEANEISGYDFYLEHYPTTEPYATLAEQKANELALKHEKTMLDRMRAEMKQRPDCKGASCELLIRTKVQDKASIILRKWRELIDQEIDKMSARMTQAKIKRLEKVMKAYYQHTPWMSTFIVTKQVDKVMEQLNSLTNIVIQNHQSLTKQLKEDFTQLQNSIDENFAQTRTRLGQIEELMKQAKRRDQELKSLVQSYVQELKAEAGEIRLQIESSKRLEILSTVLETGLSVYNLHRSSQMSATHRGSHYHFNPRVRLELNKRPRGASVITGLVATGACSGAATWVTGLSAAAIGPFAPLAGGATGLACRWGFNKLFG